MKRIYYGDLHGQFGALPAIHKRHPDADEVIVVGDWGWGFNKRREKECLTFLESVEGKSPQIRFIRGNHDNLDGILDNFGDSRTFIPDGTVEDGILYVGGAWSIDKHMRIPGYNWWEDEELTPAQWEEIFSSINAEDIHTVISHDAPDFITQLLVPKVYPTTTGHYLTLLSGMLPNLKRWVFGHYHVHFDQVVEGVHYTCLPDNCLTNCTLTHIWVD